MLNLWSHHNGKTKSGRILCQSQPDAEVLVSMKFIGKPEIISTTRKVSNEQVIYNEGDADLESVFVWTESQQEQKSVTTSEEFKITSKTEVSCDTGILPGGGVKQEIGFELTFNEQEQFTTTESKEIKQSMTIKVKPKAKVKATATLYEVRCNIPFEMTFKSGKKSKGMWEGMIQSRAEYRTVNI